MNEKAEICVMSGSRKNAAQKPLPKQRWIKKYSIYSINRYNTSFPKIRPIKSLPAAVTVSLVFSLQSKPASWADGKGQFVMEPMYFSDCHRASERLSGSVFTELFKSVFSHTVLTVTANGFRSSISKTSAILQSSFIVGLASPCSISRRYETLMPVSKAKFSWVRPFSFRKYTTVSPISS